GDVYKRQLLSWLVAHGIKAITDEIGPDCVLYPALRAQPIFDFLHKDELYAPLGLWEETQPKGTPKRMHAEEHILTPTLPNRFLVVVPAWEAARLAQKAEEAIREELRQIARACRDWFAQNNHAIPADAEARWNQQIEQFLNITWQIWPWETDVQKAIANHKPLQRVYEAAIDGIPRGELDPRNYRHDSWKDGAVWKSEIIPDAAGKPIIDNPGFAWSAHYAEIDRLHAARRNTRDFEAWAANDPHRAGAVKDMLSGKEEVIGSEQWQQGLAGIQGHYFRENERLGAINLIKRVWHKAYLHDKLGLERTPRFDSLPSVAAGRFALEVVDQLSENANAWSLLLDFQKAAAAAAKPFGATISTSQNEREWLQKTDASVFHLVEWDRRIREEKSDAARAVLQNARAALAKLLGNEGLNDAPGRYVAVLAMDGDSMGKRFSGELAPFWREQLALPTIEYFQQHPKLKELLDQPRQLSPSYHIHLSEALANFALYLAGPIVECFDGQLIYAGGDDVVALLPAENALRGARVLRMAFRGDPQLSDKFEGAIRAREEQWGFVGLSRDPEKLKRLRRFIPVGYPLIVPGKRTDVSAGIAIGHMHSPLQNLVEAARRAEKRAKDNYRDKDKGIGAFAVSLFKRSGETIQWGARWDTAAIELAQCFEDNFGNDKPLSGRFPYALAELLRKYDTPTRKDGKLEPFRIGRNGEFDAIAVIRKDLEHVVRQQGKNVPESFVATANNYLEQCQGRRLDDFLGPFLTVTFVTRGGEA
ncbi:MAG: type III-B CRISPR-associated protein Cas10/Cmr2, partial [Candidatus Sumerlaeia bacterium]|nr:type III-B CRISPR-associated protein Cas10/Cmr2 [Candidatus Sumerlaeia bacterium]